MSYMLNKLPSSYPMSFFKRNTSQVQTYIFNTMQDTAKEVHPGGDNFKLQKLHHNVGWIRPDGGVVWQKTSHNALGSDETQNFIKNKDLHLIFTKGSGYIGPTDYYHIKGTLLMLHGMTYNIEDTKPEYKEDVYRFQEKWFNLGTEEERNEFMKFLIIQIKSNQHITNEWFDWKNIIKD